MLVTEAGQTTVLSKLIGVNRVNDNAAEPLRLSGALCHDSLGEFSERVAVLLGSPSSNLQRLLSVGIVRCQQNPTVSFDGEHPVPGFQVQPIGHIFGQRGTYRAASLPQLHFARPRGDSRVMFGSRDDPPYSTILVLPVSATC